MTAVQNNDAFTVAPFGAARTVIGARERQEDAFYMGDDFVIVADGMGGQPDGDLASLNAVTAAAESMAASKGSLDPQARLYAAFATADDVILKMVNGGAYGRSPWNWPATTMLMIVKSESGTFVGHLGDSRIYSFGSDGLNQITVDHEGNTGAILRYVGNPNRDTPDVFEVDTAEIDYLIAATDGLWFYSEAWLSQFMASLLPVGSSAADTAQELVETALRFGDKRQDNITVAVIPCRL